MIYPSLGLEGLNKGYLRPLLVIPLALPLDQTFFEGTRFSFPSQPEGTPIPSFAVGISEVRLQKPAS